MTESSEKNIGLRIDVDTLRGTRRGVPALCEDLNAFGIRASFFFSVGPDNMGRNLWRLLRPDFLKKMLRSKAASLYGWDILLMGTAWPGPRIGKRCEAQIRACVNAGHEIGFHAWDHHRWQTAIDRLKPDDLRRELTRGITELTRITGRPPVSSAAPGWRCNNEALLEKDTLGFAYNSDCRGNRIFMPVVDEHPLQTPQIPVTLPTYDEIIGAPGIDTTTYNDHILSLIRPDALNVYTIHAEAEGIQCRTLFRQLLASAEKKNIRFTTLSDILHRSAAPHPGSIEPRTMPGREGWMAHLRADSSP